VRDGRHDFDFLRGRWHVRNRRLAERQVRGTEWVEFTGAVENWSLLGGLGNVDTYEVTLPDGTALNASSLRIFNPATGLWSIYWVDDRRCELFPPVLGLFTDGIGTFEGEDIEGGVPVRVRFIWSGITAEAAIWQQAFSADDGVTWETNWFMHFDRVQ
jgi:hypothetical protein